MTGMMQRDTANGVLQSANSACMRDDRDSWYARLIVHHMRRKGLHLSRFTHLPAAVCASYSNAE